MPPIKVLLRPGGGGEEMNLETGTPLDPYEIIARLGSGGMGEVYRARDERLGRHVAIKVLPADFAKDADRLLRFEQEARATSALNDPNILTVYDIGTHEGIVILSPRTSSSQADHRSDIFSFGVILYEMLAGRRAFSGESLAETMTAIVKEEPPDLAGTNSKVPPQLERIVRRCLEKKPERRFQSTSDLSFAAVRSERVVNLWVAPNEDTRGARQITSGAQRQDGTRGLAWTPDGKILYYSEASSNQDICVMEADGTGNKQLSPNARRNRDAAVSPDGRYIVWESNRTGNNNIWRMDRDGGALKQLTRGIGEYYPQISPDGNWVVYMGDSKEGLSTLWKVAIDGGDPVQLSDKLSGPPDISPDGKMIAANYLDEASDRRKIAVIPFEGGVPIRLIDTLARPVRSFIRWTPDGRALAYVGSGNAVSNIWAQPLAGGEPKQPNDFKDQRIFNFAWSRDGKKLALSRGVVNSDVVLISGFK